MISRSLMAASTKPILLSILLDGEDYGYNIIQKVKELSGGALEWADSMIYPVFRRLERDGLVSSRWVASPEGRFRKYYKITAQGRRELAEEMVQWRSVVAAMGKLRKPLPALD
jgi:PadR family transcriptional regulator PadR